MSRGQVTREKILRASLELFVEKGIAATTTREIAALAAISEGAIYRHFESKDEIAFELFRSIHVRLADMIQEIASSTQGFEDKVRSIVVTYVQLADEDPLLFAFHLRFQHLFFERFAERKRPNPVDNVEKIIADGIAAGDIPAGEPVLLGAMALGIVMQPAVHRTYGRLSDSLTDHIDRFTKSVLAVLRQE